MIHFPESFLDFYIMKKSIIGACATLLLFLLSSYFFIPGKIVITRSITANANQAGVYRFLMYEPNWSKWWPGSSSVDEGLETVFESGGYRFKTTKPFHNSFEIAIEKEKLTENSLLQIFSLGNDSIKIEWNTIINTGINPLSRIQRYFKARELSKSLDVVLSSMQKYISEVKHIYGIDIRKEKVQIEYLVSTKKTFDDYPNTENIYAMIGQIKKYISPMQVKEEDYPMLNINISDSTQFDTQVAIPVSKQLPNSGIFSSKKMLKYANILVAEITGGTYMADSAMKQIELYVTDYQYSNVALPFQSLVTDRTKVTDTSKWITRIYYPIR